MQVLAKFLAGACKIARENGKLSSKFACVYRQSKRWRHVVKVENAREVQVPLPYGHIAGKCRNKLFQIFKIWRLTFTFPLGLEWGDIDGYPIFCLHGLADNCHSFLPIAPLLSNRFRYIALDAFGHGKTSHAPPGSPMNYWELIMHLKRVVDHFKIDKFSILGHSMGGSTGLLYASLYPENVDRLVSLDMVKPVTVPLAWHKQRVRDAIEVHLDLEKKSADPAYQKSYTLEELVTRYVDALDGAIYPDAVRILLKRGAKVSGNGFNYSHDPRMVSSSHCNHVVQTTYSKFIFHKQMLPSIMRFSVEEQRYIIKGLRCHLKIIKAKRGPLYEPEKYLEEFKAIYQRQCASYEYDDSIDGTHHFHMHQPEEVAPIVNEYFSRL